MVIKTSTGFLYICPSWSGFNDMNVTTLLFTTDFFFLLQDVVENFVKKLLDLVMKVNFLSLFYSFQPINLQNLHHLYNWLKLINKWINSYWKKDPRQQIIKEDKWVFVGVSNPGESSTPPPMPFSICSFSTELQWWQGEQRNPDILLHSGVLQLLLGDSQALPGQLQDVLSPACPGLPLPTHSHPQHRQRETAGSHTCNLIWFLSVQRGSGSMPNRGGLITSQSELRL